jgi:hypothetical protein
MTLRAFHEKYPNLHTSFNSLKAEAKNRERNGFKEQRVIITKKQDPEASRSSLLISPTQYFAWLEYQQDDD